MGKKKQKKITPNQFRKELAKWMRDPNFKNKYDEGMKVVILKKMESGEIDLNSLTVDDSD